MRGTDDTEKSLPGPPMKTSSPTTSIGYSGRSTDPTWTSTIRGPRPRAFYSRRPAIGLQPDDRASLARLVVATTGLTQPDAERRVDEVAARARENISRARKSAVILAFSAAAAALLGAAAWFAACAGGRVRDGQGAVHVLWDWGRPVRR